MAEHWGYRGPDEIEKEPPKEAPVHAPGDATGVPTDQPDDGDITPPKVGEELGNVEESMEKGKYTEIVQDGYGKAVRDNLTGDLYDIDQQDALEKEGAYITAESDAVKEWAANIGDAAKYLDDVESRLYEPSDTPSGGGDTPPKVSDEIGRFEEKGPSQTIANSQAPIGLEPGDWTLPPNVKPSEIKVVERQDEKTSIVYGTERDEKGQIIGSHGHTVIGQDGEIDYARTMEGEIRTDTGE